MDPQELEIKSITASDPKLIKKKSFQYSTIPLRLGEDEKVSLLFKDVVFKIYESDYNEEKTFSLGINLKKENQQITDELEKHIQKLAMKKKQDVKKLNASFSKFTEEKLYAKLYFTNGKIKDQLPVLRNDLSMINDEFVKIGAIDKKMHEKFYDKYLK